MQQKIILTDEPPGGIMFSASLGKRDGPTRVLIPSRPWP